MSGQGPRGPSGQGRRGPLSLVGRWWPVPLFLAVIVAVQVTSFSRYDAAGHAGGHLSSATAVFGLTFVVAVLLWAQPRAVLQRPELWFLGRRSWSPGCW